MNHVLHFEDSLLNVETFLILFVAAAATTEFFFQHYLTEEQTQCLCDGAQILNRKATSNNLRAEESESGISVWDSTTDQGLSLTSAVRAQEAAALRKNRLSNVFAVAVLLC